MRIMRMLIVPLLAMALMFTATMAIKNSGDDVYEMQQEVEDSVYLLKRLDRSGHGTGFVTVNSFGKKVMITNAHVCEDGPNMMQAISKDNKPTIIHILKVSSKTDLCMLTAPRNSISLQLANKLIKNQEVYAVGYPLSYFMNAGKGRLKGYQQFIAPTEIPVDKCVAPRFKVIPQKVPIRKADGSKGIKIVPVCFSDMQVLFTTIPTDHGYSGSPMLNQYGEVVGVIVAMHGNVSWGLSIPLRDLKEFLK